MSPRPRRPRLLGLAVLLLSTLAAGCILPVDPAPDAGTTPDATGTVPPADIPTTDLGTVHFELHEARAHVFARPVLYLDLYADPHPAPRPFQIDWVLDDAPLATDHTTLGANATTASVTRTLTGLAHGDHTIVAAVRNDTGSPATHLRTTFTVWAPVRLILNASERYAADQNAFQTDHVVPFAPWQKESALHVLERAAERHGFAYTATYREDMESHFVEAINGTAFRWDLPQAGVSRNWMLLHDGTVTGTAVDHTRPAADDTLEFRYTRCTPAHCEDVG